MQKRTFNKKHKIVQPYKVGDVVMAIDHTRTSKWDPVYEGPFTITEVHKGGSYTLHDRTGEVLPRRMTTNMLKYIPEPMDNGDPSGGEGGHVQEARTVKRNRSNTQPQMLEHIPEHNNERQQQGKKDIMRNTKKVTTEKTNSSSTPATTTNKDSDYYRVDHIIDHMYRKGKLEYKVRWHGYDQSTDSWVREHDFADTAVIKRYWSKRLDSSDSKPHSHYRRATAHHRA